MKNEPTYIKQIVELLQKATESQRRAAYFFVLKMVNPGNKKSK